MTSTKTLFDLTAEDVMSQDVLTIPAGMSVRAAAHRLAQAGVSGAPVVDDWGRCLGVLSKTDLVRYIERGPRPAMPNPSSPISDWQMMDLDALPGDNVTSFMTPAKVTTQRNTRIGELARIMYDSHIHRVLITDCAGKVVGIVSPMDILAALAAHAGQEPCSEIRRAW
jgi:CBS-domain-containing membrane protein